MKPKSAIAIGAHPDDIEFFMAGTLLQLRARGWQIHYLNVASGSCGTVRYGPQATRRIRTAESRAAAKILGAQFHPSLTEDLEIFYTPELLRKVAAVIRETQPQIVLTHSPQDYMEDHTNTCRLAVTAAFARGMPNFKTVPRRSPGDYDVTVYHAMPHGGCDGLRRRVVPGAFVNTTPVQSFRHRALAAHKSQQHWLDVSQGMNSYLRAMEEAALRLGRQSKAFKYAEGWRRHLHIGFSSTELDPLRDALGRDYRVNPAYERSLANAT